MQPTEFIWFNGAFIPWQDAKIHVLSYGLHYGGSVFEGMRAYATARGPAVFREREHFERLLYSASTLKMKIPYSVDQLGDATRELILRNKLDACYIRPIALLGYGVMGLHAKGAPVDVAIACWPWAKYLAKEGLDVMVPKTRRISPLTLHCDAKVSGHYVNSLVALHEIGDRPYDEVLLLDLEGNVAEGSAENVFFVKHGEIITPSTGTILVGITRETIIHLARDLGIKVTERAVTLQEALDSDEAFFSGTACEVNSIRSINDKVISAAPGPVSTKLKELYMRVVSGKEPRFESFLSYAQK